MAKRFTDTAKWDKAWFRKLSPELKCAWMFLCDRCDHAGVWDIDRDAIEFFIGGDLSLNEIIGAFGQKVEIVGDKLIVHGFNDFQYGALNPENRVHKSVLDRLEKVKNKGLIRTLQGSKDTDTDKDTEKDKGECEGKTEKPLKRKFTQEAESVYAGYPRKLGKADGVKKLVARFKAGLPLADALAARDRFVEHHKTQHTEREFLPYFATWVGDLDDWLDPDAGHAEDFSHKAPSLDDLVLPDYGPKESA